MSVAKLEQKEAGRVFGFTEDAWRALKLNVWILYGVIYSARERYQLYFGRMAKIGVTSEDLNFVEAWVFEKEEIIGEISDWERWIKKSVCNWW